MILAISTSSPVVSLALIYEGKVLASAEESAPRAASRAILVLVEQMLAQRNLELGHLTATVADVGPGSFTGVKVGVMAAKTLAYARGLRCGGIDAFALIHREEPVAIPSRKGEWILPDGSLVSALEDEVLTYSATGGTYPRAESVLGNLDRVRWGDPLTLVPHYMLQPSISQPKQEILKKVIGP